jgi:hypothetical protein
LVSFEGDRMENENRHTIIRAEVALDPP